MAGWKLWASGEVVNNTDFQNYLQDQVVQVYAGTAARSSALGTAVSEGMMSYLNDINAVEYYDGSSWQNVASGTAPGFANPMTTLGDLIVGGTAGVAQRLGVGTNGQYLFTNGTAASWAGLAPANITAGTFSAGNFTFGSALAVTGLLTAKPAEPATNSDTAGAVGYVGLPQVALSSGGTTISKAHAGEHIYNTSAGTVTIPANGSVPLEIGTTVVIINGNNTSAVNITTDTLRQAGTSNTGARTIAAYGMATLVKVASTTWMISGNGVS